MLSPTPEELRRVVLRAEKQARWATWAAVATLAIGLLNLLIHLFFLKT